VHEPTQSVYNAKKTHIRCVNFNAKCRYGCLLQVTRQDVAFRDDHQDHHDHDVDCYHPQHWLPQDTRWATQIGADGMTSLSDADCIHPLLASYPSAAASLSSLRSLLRAALSPAVLLSLALPSHISKIAQTAPSQTKPFITLPYCCTRRVFQLSSAPPHVVGISCQYCLCRMNIRGFTRTDTQQVTVHRCQARGHSTIFRFNSCEI
jgi:hypothetical protein